MQFPKLCVIFAYSVLLVCPSYRCSPYFQSEHNLFCSIIYNYSMFFSSNSTMLSIIFFMPLVTILFVGLKKLILLDVALSHALTHRLNCGNSKTFQYKSTK